LQFECNLVFIALNTFQGLFIIRFIRANPRSILYDYIPEQFVETFSRFQEY